MGHGGARKGAGKPRGSLSAKTMDKLLAREELRRMVVAAMGPMVRAQIMASQGIGHVFTRDKNGKFTRIEDMSRIEHLLATGTEDEDYYIFAKDPSVGAFSELINHALDKAPQHVAVTGSEGGPIELVARLQIARRAHTREG